MKCKECDKPNASCWINTKHVCRMCYYKAKLKKPMCNTTRTRSRTHLRKHLKAIKQTKELINVCGKCAEHVPYGSCQRCK